MYSLAAGAFIAGTDKTDAAIVYTDINPNFAGAVGSEYFLDLNNDNIDDFRIYHDSSYNLFLEPLTGSNSALGSGSGNFAYPYALSSSAPISASAAGSWFNNGYSTGYMSLNYGSYGTFGNFIGVTDKYIGLRFTVGTNTYYGWVRLDVNSNGSVWAVKDYAYEDVSGTSILAGAMPSGPSLPSSPATLVTAADAANNSNGTDLAVGFAAAADETLLNEYRLMVVKDANSSSFDLAAAQAVASGDYTSVTPTGATAYAPALLATSTDVDGDLIANGEPYTVFVLSIADGVNATTDTLSTPSAVVTLQIPASAATNIVATDIDDQSNGADLGIAFDAAANELAVGEYRVMVVKDVNVSSFDLTAAQAVNASNFTTVNPTGGTSYPSPLASNATDVDGDQITNGQAYSVFVMTLADGVNALNDTLSSASNSITLQIPPSAAANLVASDVDDQNDGTDLELTFDAAANELAVGEYRMLAVKAANASSFDLAAAQAVPAGNYKAVSPSDSTNYTETFAGSNDINGDAISVGETYTLFVLSMADGVNALSDTLSNASNDVTLNIQVNAVANVAGADVTDNVNASDLEVSFDAAVDENEISEYRVFVVKMGNTFDQAIAETMPAANYFSQAPAGNASYSFTVNAALKDSDGDDIAQNTDYEIYVLSVANGTDANLNALSDASESVMLKDILSVDELAASNINIWNNGNQLNISGLSGNQSKVFIYDLTGKMIETFTINDQQAMRTLNVNASGIYIVQVNDQGASTSKKLFIR